ncbi:MAG TPA: hypothetical protein VFL97_03940, partial [Nitrococcus sp.]|nr:hypothetical protein [Nitrococcus sp.]
MGRLFAQLIMVLLIFGVCLLSWYGKVQPPNRLQLVKERHKLIVLTRIGASTYYQSSEGPGGLEYDLAKL